LLYTSLHNYQLYSSAGQLQVFITGLILMLVFRSNRRIIGQGIMSEHPTVPELNNSPITDERTVELGRVAAEAARQANVRHALGPDPSPSQRATLSEDVWRQIADGLPAQ